MINTDFLESLFTLKVEAKQELQKEIKSHGEIMPAEQAACVIKIREIRVAFLQKELGNYNKIITAYLNSHKD